MPKFNTRAIKTDAVIDNSQHHIQAVEFLKKRVKKPEILMILGSGLGSLADEITSRVVISYKDIPYFKTSTAPGHIGRFVSGKLGGKNVLAMEGRLHVYEGCTPYESAFPVRVAAELGCKVLLTTCACGGVNTSYNVGDICVITDHINFTHTGPMVGMDMKSFKERFIDMSTVYDKEYRALAKKSGEKNKVNLVEGVYYYMPGPTYETPAEIKAIRTLGGDLVGMSLVHEVEMARLHEMRILGLGLVTNMAAGILDQPLSEAEVIEEGNKAKGKFSKLIKEIIPKL